jgi:hypothetical protein
MASIFENGSISNFHSDIDIDSFTNFYGYLKSNLKKNLDFRSNQKHHFNFDGSTNLSYPQFKILKDVYFALQSLIKDPDNNIFDFKNDHSKKDIEENYHFLLLPSNINDFIKKSNKMVKFINQSYGRRLNFIKGVDVKQEIKQTEIAGVDIMICQRYVLKF